MIMNGQLSNTVKPKNIEIPNQEEEKEITRELRLLFDMSEDIGSLMIQLQMRVSPLLIPTKDIPPEVDPNKQPVTEIGSRINIIRSCFYNTKRDLINILNNLEI